MFDYDLRVTLLGQQTFDQLGTPLVDVPFCVLDLETTGLSFDTDAITEIGAVRYEQGVEIGRFQTLVNPDAPIPPRVTVITGITHATVVDAPRIGEALPSFLEFLGEAVIVGHNVRFDIGFLNAASIRLGYGRLSNRSVDTLRLARRLIGREVRSLKLSSLAAYLGSPTTPNHRALEDSLATAHVFWSLLERAGSIGVTHLDDLLALPTIKGARAAAKLSLTEGLPRTPGVYTFRDRAGTAIYIGKATNLRTRVRSYFAGDTRRRIDDLLRELHTIDHELTLNEFEASVLEVRAIAVQNPRYNRRSRTPRSLHWVAVTSEKFPRVSVVRSRGAGLLHLGPFRSRRAAEAVKFALWDATRLRRCSTTASGCDSLDPVMAACPHNESVTVPDYLDIVHEVVRRIGHDSRPLLDRVRLRIAALVDNQRFEDAVLVRDRWIALRTAIISQRRWMALQQAERILATGADGVAAAIDRGRLTAVLRAGEPAALVPTVVSDAKPFAETMADMEEAGLVWRWLAAPGVTIEEVTGTLGCPSIEVPTLDGKA